MVLLIITLALLRYKVKDHQNLNMVVTNCVNQAISFAHEGWPNELLLLHS